MIAWNTIVTDVLAAIGVLILIFSPLYFSSLQRKILNQRLHTKVDGEKLFEKLKYDLKLSKITNVNKKRLYTDIHYAKSIFRGAMEYNSREVIWYFNELYAKRHIHNNIRKKAWLHTWIWIGTILVIMGGTYFDFFSWIFNMSNMVETSGIISIWVLITFASGISILNKFLEFSKVKKIVNDDIRQINLTKKEKVWKDFKIIFYFSIGNWILGFIFIFINVFFN
ncbi:hypothetical protein [Spiroplasma taiwanense]|uniref:Transmembrane protein n=1 Tax=Spiroplasma taiwanense CT-1 TaxID=1276220 RepID=S5LUF0_9MOLU|nr:hypothetical protein [Spiroplasma taiwanense]AGR41414.1 hypothetical protein STAIW_v1c08260 [Spiroplasma taiwanense CT-1]